MLTDEQIKAVVQGIADVHAAGKLVCWEIAGIPMRAIGAHLSQSATRVAELRAILVLVRDNAHYMSWRMPEHTGEPDVLVMIETAVGPLPKREF